MVTQVDIAKRVGLDVSSCNKILNQVVGPVFKKETIALVLRTAKEMGYNLRRETKHSLRRENALLKRALKDVVEATVNPAMPPLTPRRMTEIRELLDGPKSKRATG